MNEAQWLSRWWRKYSSLDLARAAALGYSLFDLAAMTPGMFFDPRTASARPLGAGGFVGLVAALVLTFVRRRLFFGEPVVVPVLMVLAGAPLADPHLSIEMAERIVPPQSLYGSVASTVVRTVLLCVGLPLVVVLYPTAPGYTWNTPAVFVEVPGVLLLAALMWVLRVAVVRQTKATERVRTLIATGTELLHVTDVDRVFSVAAAAADELSRSAPGTVSVLIRLNEDAVVVGLAGAEEPRVGTRFPPAAWRRLADRDVYAERIEVLAPYVGDLWWRGAALDLADQRLLAIVGAAHPVSDDVLDAFALLASQRTEGELRGRANAELAYRAGHDTVTDLLNRREFLARLDKVMQVGGAPEIAVVGMDLDNFKVVNDTYGHQAGDDVLRVVARRLGDVLGTAAPADGFAARLGGDEFAVLVSAGDRRRVEDLVRTIYQRLQEPIMVADNVAPVGVSLGVAYQTDETTAVKLLDNADVAMYRAKESGKNRIVNYSPGDEDQNPGGR